MNSLPSARPELASSRPQIVAMDAGQMDAEEALALATLLSNGLAAAGASRTHDAAREALATLCGKLGGASARLCEFGTDPGSLAATLEVGIDAPPWLDLGREQLRLWVAAQFAGREITLVHEPEALPLVGTPEPEAPGTLLLVPIFSGTRDVGGLLLESPPGMAFSVSALVEGMLRIVAAALGAAVERARQSAPRDALWIKDASELMPGVLCQAYLSSQGELEFRALSGIPATGANLAAALEDPAVLLERIDSRDRKRFWDSLTAAARDLSPWSLDFRMATVTGELRWISARGIPKRVADGGTLFTGLGLDVTSQKRAEATLAVSETRYRTLFDSAPIMMHSADSAGRIVRTNRKWLVTLGYERAEALGRRTSDFLTPESQARFAGCEREFSRTCGIEQLACQLVARGGEVLDVIMSAHAEKGAGGEVIAASFAFVDVTDLNRALKAFRESEARYRAIVHDQTELICRFDCRGHLRFVNHAVVRCTGREILDLIGTDWLMLLEPDQRKSLRQRLGSLTASRPLLHTELLIAGHERWYQWTIRAFFDAAGEPTGYQAVGRDIQELKSLEKQMREISHREQRRIGHDLHDGLGQELTGASLLMKTLEQEARQSYPELSKRLQPLRELIDRAIATTRALAQGLSPLGVEQEGLAAALRKLAARTQAVYGVEVRFVPGRGGTLGDASAAMDLYRIAQEALNNAAKHSQARHITLKLALEPAQAVIEVADDGRGLPEENERGRGMGLQIMRHRASMIGAALEVVPGERGGTVVRCVLRQGAAAAQGLKGD